MNTKSTYTLLVIALAMFAFIWFFERKTDPTQKSEAYKKRILLFERSDVTKVELKNRVHPDRAASLERKGDQWQFKTPVTARADTSAVNALLDTVQYVESQRRWSEKDQANPEWKKTEHGLGSPQIEVVLTVSGKPVSVKVGNEAPIGNAIYLQASASADLLHSKSPSHVFLVGKNFLAELDKPIADFRDRTVADLQVNQLNKFEIRVADAATAGGRKLAASKSDSRWKLTAPIAARANLGKIEELARKITDLRREDFTDDDPKDLKPYGLDDPAAEITLIGKESEGAKIIQLGVPTKDGPDKLYAKRKDENSVFTVKSDILNQLKIQPNDLREKQIADFNRESVKGIEFTAGGATTKLQYDGSWRVTAPESVAAEPNAVSDLLERLGKLVALEFVADAPASLADYGLDNPTLRLSLLKAPLAEPKKDEAKKDDAKPAAPPTASAVPPIVELLFGKANEEKKIAYVKRADEPFVYSVPQADYQIMPRNFLDVRDRNVLTINGKDIQMLEIVRADAKFKLQRTGDKDKTVWSFLEPSQGVLDNDALQNVLVVLSIIKAEKWVAMTSKPEELAAYGLDKPQIAVHFELPSAGPAVAGAPPAPSQKYLLLIGAESSPEKLRFAKLADSSLIFLLEDFAFSQFSRNFIATPKPAEPAKAPDSAKPADPAKPADAPPLADPPKQ